MKQITMVGCYVLAGICMLCVFYFAFQFVIEPKNGKARKVASGDALKHMFASSMLMAFFCLGAMFLGN
ncbi:MAG: hypothetical protein K5750_04215 [Eubacterium sp.]|nr:hypothetical protein [Eubacterium sp.]